MFKKFFGRDEEEEVFDTLDPVLEQRRKEKFSAPLIYNEVEEEKEEEVKKVPDKKPTPVSEATYRMSEIISPISGVTKRAEPEIKIQKPKKKKPKKESDSLIPIISPFYGMTDDIVEEKEVKDEKVVVKEEVTVEDKLRDIASIVKEEQDQLRIIEERTGEFKFDFKNENEDSFIDEIDDSMSLDELMSLYEKKFKD